MELIERTGITKINRLMSSGSSESSGSSGCRFFALWRSLTFYEHWLEASWRMVAVCFLRFVEIKAMYVWHWVNEARRARVRPSSSPQCWSARTSCPWCERKDPLWWSTEVYCSSTTAVHAKRGGHHSRTATIQLHHNNLVPSNASHWSTTRSQDGLKFRWVETQPTYTLWLCAWEAPRGSKRQWRNRRIWYDLILLNSSDAGF